MSLVYFLKKDKNANHFVQKIITKLNEDSRQILNNIIIDNLMTMMKNNNGLAVLKVCCSETLNKWFIEQMLQKIDSLQSHIFNDSIGSSFIVHLLNAGF